MKTIKVAACLSMLFLLTGCTALLWGGNKVTESKTVKTPQFRDNVTSVFQYKNLAASVVQDKTSTPLIIPSTGVAFLGEQNIYILTRGATELLSLNKIIDRIPLISGEEENTLKLKVIPPEKGDVIFHFKDSLQVEVNKKYGAVSPEDITIIEQSGFRDIGGTYWKNIDIEGVIIPRKNLNYPFTGTEPLGRKYSIEFYLQDSKTDFHPGNLATNVVFTPFAVVADIVFFPISISVLQLINGPS